MKSIELKDIMKTVGDFKMRPIDWELQFKKVYGILGTPGAGKAMEGIELKDITKKIGDFKVGPINWKLQFKKVYGVLGPSGSGKTILLDILAGRSKPDTGSIKVLGETTNLKKIIGFVPQEPSFYRNLSVWENILYFGSLYDLDKIRLVEVGAKYLEYMDMSRRKHTLASKLSGGEQKRLNMILSILHRPEIILLDEPTDQLDPISREEIWDIIQDFKAQGFLVVLTSHLMKEIELLCDEVFIIVDGKQTGVGTVDELIEKYHPENQLIFRTEPGDAGIYEKLRKEAENWPVERMVNRHKTVVIITDQPDTVEGKAADFLKSHGEKLVEISRKRPDLEDIFMAVIGKKGVSIDKKIL